MSATVQSSANQFGALLSEERAMSRRATALHALSEREESRAAALRDRLRREFPDAWSTLIASDPSQDELAAGDAELDAMVAALGRVAARLFCALRAPD